MIIAKFGGGILSTAEDMQRVANTIASRKPDVVVVSALSGVTDQLIHFVEQSLKENEIGFEEFCARHRKIANKKIDAMEEAFNDLKKTLQGVNYTGEASDRLRAVIMSRGEYLSAVLLQSYLPQYKFVPSEKSGLVAQGDYLNARCNFQKSKLRTSNSIITTGFYALNEKGEICLFGRGGSDYSAGAIAKLTSAKKVEFWKNVDGFLTADPRLVADARAITALSFEEAAEICRFGARILHPSALEPLMGSETIVETKNIFKPGNSGTTIYDNCKKNKIAAVSGRKKISVVSVSGNEMVEAFGIAAKIMTKVADAGIAVDVIATAQANISFSIEQKDGQKAIDALKELKTFEIRLRDNLSLVGIVGDGIKNDPAFLSKIFSVLSKEGIAIKMISQGAMESDVSIIVQQSEYENAIKAIHDELIGR